jgi:hypothetical protein
MTIFNHFKHGVDVTKFKADQLLRINRIQSEIDGLRPKISEMHIRIANTAYELHQQGKLMNSELVELCAAIDDINRQMAEKESLINAIREEQPPQGCRHLPRQPISAQTAVILSPKDHYFACIVAARCQKPAHNVER